MEHLGGKLLEGEDGRVVKYAEECYDPEDTLTKDLTQVTELKGFLFLYFLVSEFIIKCTIHEPIHDVEEQANAEQERTEDHWSLY